MLSNSIAIRFLQQFIQVAITILIARVIEPVGNGVFSLFITDTSFFIILLGLCLETSVTYFVSKNNLSLSVVASNAAVLYLLQSAAFFVLYFLAASLFNHTFFLLGNKWLGLLCGFVFVSSILLFNYAGSYLTGRKSFYKQIVYYIFFQLLFLAVCSFLYFSNKVWFLNADHVTFLYTLLMVGQALVYTAYLWFTRTESIEWTGAFKKLPDNLVAYARTVYTANLLQFLAYRIDMWLLDYYQPKSEIGLYAFAVKISQLWWVFPQLLSSMIFPLTAQQHVELPNRRFRKIMQLNILLGITAALAAVLLFPLFIQYTVGDLYNSSYELLLILLPGIILFSINILLAAKMAGEGNVKTNRTGSAICLVVMLALDFYLIPSHGAKGAAIASSIAYGVSSLFIIINYFFWKREKK